MAIYVALAPTGAGMANGTEVFRRHEKGSRIAATERHASYVAAQIGQHVPVVVAPHGTSNTHRGEPGKCRVEVVDSPDVQAADLWPRTYWLLRCGTLIYRLAYGSRALLILRNDPLSRFIANRYLAASAAGVLWCGARIACIGAGFALASAHSWRIKTQVGSTERRDNDGSGSTVASATA
jgi:hypothetical protein